MISMDMPKGFSTPMNDDKGYISYEQGLALIKAAGSLNERYELLVKSLFYTGRRIGEVVGKFGITPDVINYDGGFITFFILKKNPRRKDKTLPKELPVKRAVPVYPPLLEDLRAYIVKNDLLGRPNDVIFDMTVRNAEYVIERIGLVAGEMYPDLFPDEREINGRRKIFIGHKPLHPHHFRHGFAVHLAKNMGGSLEDSRQLQLLLQHSDLTITQEYLKYSLNDTKRLLNKAFNRVKPE